MRRRSFVKTLAASAATVGIATTTASAGGGNDNLDGPSDYPGVSTRDHFEITWYGSVELADDETSTSFDFRGDWGNYWDGDELFLMVHGWNNDREGAIDTAYTADRGLQEQGYDEIGAVYTWDSDKGGGLDDGWYEAQEIAQENGPKLAAFVYYWTQEWYPDVPIRIEAHSLGAQVVGSAVRTLRNWGLSNVLQDVVLLGGAADNDECAVEGDYGPGFEYAAEQVVNCYKTDDGVLEWAYSLGELDRAVGETGVEGTTPSNMTELDVTNVVPDHYSHYELKADGGCQDLVVGTW